MRKLSLLSKSLFPPPVRKLITSMCRDYSFQQKNLNSNVIVWLKKTIYKGVHKFVFKTKRGMSRTQINMFIKVLRQQTDGFG